MEEWHKQELEELKKSYLERAEELKKSYNESTAQLKRQLQSMSAQIAALQKNLKRSFLTEEELKVLDRFHQGQRFKRSSEQIRLLKNRKEVSRSEEKDDFNGDGSSLSSQDVSCGSSISSGKEQNGKKNMNTHPCGLLKRTT